MTDPQKTHVEILVEELRKQLRQHSALLAECVGVMDDCGTRLRLVIEADSTMTYCCQPLVDRIAALNSRIAALKG